MAITARLYLYHICLHRNLSSDFDTYTGIMQDNI
jgi:hypothetical protein